MKMRTLPGAPRVLDPRSARAPRATPHVPPDPSYIHAGLPGSGHHRPGAPAPIVIQG